MLRMGDGRLVLSDFGLATDVGESTTSIHGGTIAYMAPEIVRGGRASVASDIWALGVVIHEIVFGDKPRWRRRRGRRCGAAARTELTDGGAGGPGGVPRLHGQGARAADRERGARLRGCSRTAAVVGAAVDAIGAVTRNGRGASSLLAAGGARSRALAVESPWPQSSHTRRSAAHRADRRGPPIGPKSRSSSRKFRNGSVHQSAPGQAHDPFRRGRITACGGSRYLHPQTRSVAGSFRRLCRGLSGLVARRQAHGVHRAHGGQTPVRLRIAAALTGSQAVPVVPIAEPTMTSEPTWMADGQSFS